MSRLLVDRQRQKNLLLIGIPLRIPPHLLLDLLGFMDLPQEAAVLPTALVAVASVAVAEAAGLAINLAEAGSVTVPAKVPVAVVSRTALVAAGSVVEAAVVDLAINLVAAASVTVPAKAPVAVVSKIGPVVAVLAAEVVAEDLAINHAAAALVTAPARAPVGEVSRTGPVVVVSAVEAAAVDLAIIPVAVDSPRLHRRQKLPNLAQQEQNPAVLTGLPFLNHGPAGMFPQLPPRPHRERRGPVRYSRNRSGLPIRASLR